LILIVYSLIIQYSGQGQNKSLGFITFIIFFAGIIWSCVTYSKQLNANVTFGNVFADGFKVTAAVAALMSLFSFILFNFISPELKDEAIRQMQTEMEKTKASDGQIEKSIEFTKSYFNVLIIGLQLLYLLVAGVIASVIGAAVARKNPHGPFEQQA